MAVSPADFELYSRATGVPYPRTPEERMRMAPEVHQYARNYARRPSALQKVAGAVGKAAQIGGTLAGAYGIAKALGPQAGAVASAVADEVINQSKGPSGVVITDLTTPKEKFQYHRDYSGNKSGNYGERDKTYEKPGFYDEIAEHDFDSPQSDGFVEPRVRIPTRREEKPPTERHQRKTVIREGKNYGNPEPKRDLVAEADAKAAEILGGQLATREGGGQIEDPWFDEGNTRRYDRFEGAGLATKGRTDTRGGLRKTVEDASLNYPVERDMLVGGTAATAGAVGKNIADAANIVAGGEGLGNPVTNTVTQALGGVKEAALQKIPPYHALTESIQGGVETAQNAYETIRGLGFAPGANVGTVLDWAGTQASNFPGAATVSEIGGNVLEAMGQVATNMPIEAFFGITGAVGGATAMGVARGLNKTSKVGSNLLEQASQAFDKTQKIINSVKTDHAQIDSPGQDQKRIAPNTTIHTEGSIQGSEPGLGAHVDSGTPQTNRRREELRETFRKSLGTVPPEKREALIDQQLEKESNSKGLSQLKNFVSKAMSSDIAQAGDQAAKKVVRSVLRTVAGEEKFQEMAAENLREQQAERMRAMAGNEARMANIRAKYSMDYNPAAPKLPGDAIIGLNKDRFGGSAYIPTGGIDMLRDESVPASAYDVRLPREDEDTPLWWEV